MEAFLNQVVLWPSRPANQKALYPANGSAPHRIPAARLKSEGDIRICAEPPEPAQQSPAGSFGWRTATGFHGQNSIHEKDFAVGIRLCRRINHTFRQ
jgi:hypothetical protein